MRNSTRSSMTTEEMLYFGGGVLGPALAAQAVATMLKAIPELSVERKEYLATVRVENLLHQAFPDGLDL